MKLSKRQLSVLIESFLKESPLALGDDGKPSIIVPGDKEEREEFESRTKAVDVHPELDSRAPNEFAGTLFGDDGKIFGMMSGDSFSDGVEHDIEIGDQVNEYISGRYKELYLSAGNVKRVQSQLSRFPIDVHFVLLPQFVGPGQGFDSAFNTFSQATNLSSGDSLETNVGHMRNNAQDVKWLEHELGLSRQNIVSANDSRMAEYNIFIKDYIKEKTGAVVKPDDLVVVNFVVFRNTRHALKLNDFERAKSFIDSIIKKRFYFIDSIYNIFHTFFDGGPMSIPLANDELTEDQGIFINLFSILSKYDPFFNFPATNYKQFFANAHRSITQQEFDELVRKAKSIGTDIVQDSGSNTYRALDNQQLYDRYGNWDKVRKISADSLRLGLTTPVIVRSVNKKVISPESEYNSQRTAKPDEVGQILRSSSSAGVRDIFKPKTIKSGKINTAFDFYAELCNVAFLNQTFPVDIEKLKNNEIISDDDKKQIMNEFIPYMENLYSEILEFTDKLKGKFVYGSASDVTRN